MANHSPSNYIQAAEKFFNKSVSKCELDPFEFEQQMKKIQKKHGMEDSVMCIKGTQCYVDKYEEMYDL